MSEARKFKRRHAPRRTRASEPPCPFQHSQKFEADMREFALRTGCSIPPTTELTEDMLRTAVARRLEELRPSEVTIFKGASVGPSGATHEDIVRAMQLSELLDYVVTAV
jgi:hypothetical protein